MKTIFVVLTFAFITPAWGQCFRDKIINQTLEDIYGPCGNFPAEIEISAITVETEEDVTLYAEDMARLKTTYFTLKGTKNKDIQVDISGQLKFNSKMYGLFVGEFISRINEGEGLLDLRQFSYISVRNFPMLLQRIGNTERYSLAIYSREDETIDLHNAELQGMFTVYNAGKVQNVKVRATNYFQIVNNNKKRTVVSNVDVEAGTFFLINSEFYPMEKPIKAENFKLTDSVVREPGITLANTTDISFDLEKSSLLFKGPERVQTSTVSLLNSKIEGTVLELQENIDELSIQNSEVTFDHLRTGKNMEEFRLSGKISVLHPEVPLSINSKMKIVRMISLEMPGLVIDLHDPKNLMLLDLTGTKTDDLQILNPENGRLVPHFFSAHARDRATQKKLRKIFRTKNVSNENWLPL